MGGADGSSSDDDVKTVAEKKPVQKAGRQGKAAIQLDQGTEEAKYRRRFYQLHLPRDPPPPPPTSLEDAKEIPLARASIINMLTFTWITPMIVLGFQRPLQATDLWQLDASRQAGLMSTQLDESWKRRCEKADAWNARLESGEMKAPLTKRVKWTLRSMGRAERYREFEQRWRDVDGRREPSLAWAINDVLGRSFWAGGTSYNHLTANHF